MTQNTKNPASAKKDNLFFVSKDDSFLENVVDVLTQEKWDFLILPHKQAAFWVQQFLIRRSCFLQLPEILTADSPLGYEHSCLLTKIPLPFAKGLTWMIELLKKHGYDDGKPLTHLMTLASSLLELWEHVTRNKGHWERLDLLNSNNFGRHTQKTLDIIKCVGQFWPSFVHKKGFCSQAESQEEAVNILIKRWKEKTPGKILVAGMQDITPNVATLIKAVTELPESLLLVTANVSKRFSFLGNSLHQWQRQKSIPISHDFSGIFKKTSIGCGSLIEQARVIALLIREGLENPDAVISFTDTSLSIAPYVQEELKRWNINLPLLYMPLVSHFLIFTMEAIIQNWPLEKLIALGRHPLVIKAHPVSVLMASHMEIFKIESVPVKDQPRWMGRALAMISHAAEPLQKNIEQSKTLGQWLTQHLEVIERLVPRSFWDNSSVIEKLWKEQLSFHQKLSVNEYVLLLTELLKPIKPAASLDQRLYFCSLDDISFISPTRCIIVPSQQQPIFPWLTKSIKEALSFHHEFTCIEEIFAREIFLVSIADKPSEIPIRQLANNIDIPVTALIHQPLNYVTPSLNRVSISDLQLWKNDFDEFYKRRILSLRNYQLSIHQLWGMSIHTLMDQFIKSCPPCKAYTFNELFEEIKLLAEHILPISDFIQQHLVNNLLRDIVTNEWEKRKLHKYTSVTEANGSLLFSFPEGTIKLIARADRIDYLDDGSIHIIDYKTGTLPSFIDLDNLKSLQLPLEALIAAEGGFLTKVNVSEISWWHMSLSKGCKIKTYPRSVSNLLAKYHQQLPLWLRDFVCGTYFKTDNVA